MTDVHGILADALIVVLMVGVGFAKVYLGRLLSSHGLAGDQAFLDSIIDRAAQFGVNEVQNRVGSKPIDLDLKNDVLNSALGFVTQQAEAEKTRLGYSDDDIAKLILAHLDLSGGSVTKAGAAPPAMPQPTGASS